MKEDGYRFKTKPFAHQLKDWLRSRDLEYFAVFWEMGTGKSKLILDTAAWLYDSGKIDSILVIANKGSFTNWADEHIPKHLPSHIPAVVECWDSGAGKKKFIDYESLHLKEGLRIMLMNVEALAFNKGRKFAEKFVIKTRCLGVIDECTSIKNPKAQRTKAALRLSGFFKYRRILTGSPVTNGPLNLYTQAEFLKGWLLGHGSWYSFRSEYCEMVEMRVGRASFKKIVGYKNLEKLREKMLPWSSTIKKEDCLDLPPKIYEVCLVEMTAEQEKLYEEMRRRSIAELKGQVVTAEIVLTKLLRLQQILSGLVPDEEGRSIEVPENRTTTLLELLEESSGKAIIWARFVGDIKKISAVLKKEYSEKSVVEYFGETSQDERRLAIKEFQEGEARFFVGNPQTAGYGITLTAASTVIYYSNSFDLEIRAQSEDRCHRVGQTKSVTYIDLCCPKTVDEKIVKALKDKKKISDLIMSGILPEELI